LKQRRLKTFELGSGTQSFTIARGHVSASEFNKRHIASGTKGIWIKRDDLHHIYMKQLKDSFSIRPAHHKGVKPFTVKVW
jgi:hypothetical protein